PDRSCGDQRPGDAPEDLLGLVVDVRKEPPAEIPSVLGTSQLAGDEEDSRLADEETRVARLRRPVLWQLDVVRPGAKELYAPCREVGQVERCLGVVASSQLV